jgi:DNA-binding CsgD family transcriptional regulator
VAVPEGVDARLRYLAHVGIIGLKPHQPTLREPTPMAAKAVATGELVQLVRSDGGPPHGCINLPITGGDRALGFLGLGMHVPVPLEPWREEMVWAMADLMALLLLKRRSPRRAAKSGNGSSLPGLTPRQREVLFDLVEHSGGNADIGERFGLSARTIKIHLMAAYRRLGVHSRAEAIRLVFTQHGDWLAQERASRRRRSGGD